MSGNGKTCPMEDGVKALLRRLNIKFECDDHRSGLDFFLPEYGVYIEVKQYHSDRIAEQMGRKPNVIAIQGLQALEMFCDLAGKDEQPQ